MLTFKQSLVELTENISRMKGQLREVEIQSESQIQSRIKEAAPPLLRIDLAAGVATIDGHVLRLSEARFLWFGALALAGR